jgi:hypothetical protein
MATICLRCDKTSGLTNTEMDNNIKNLNTELGTTLKTTTSFSGDVSGCYGNLAIGANKVGANELCVGTNGTAGYYLKSDGDGTFSWGVPTNTTYSEATSSAYGLVKTGFSCSGKCYPVQLSSGKMYVNVPWCDTNTTYSAATSSAYGLVKTGFSATGKCYPVQLSSGKMYVNVPWVDTNTDTNTTYTAGTNLCLNGTQFNVCGTVSCAGNSDKVDGIHASSFVRSDAADTVSCTLTHNAPILMAKTGTATSTTCYPSNRMIFTASGWDNNGPYARDVCWSIQSSTAASAYPEGYLDFYEESPSFGHLKVRFVGRGSGASYQSPNAACFYGQSSLYQSGAMYGTSLYMSGSSGNFRLRPSTDRAALALICSYTTGYGGLQITNCNNDGLWSFMTDGTHGGLYDDQNGKWHLIMYEGSCTAIHFNGSTKLKTLTGGVCVYGDLTASGNVTAYSDARLKCNITTIDNSLCKIRAMRGVSYEKDDAQNVGVIAQEVETVLPEVVTTDEDGMKAVAYGNIVGVLIEAIKEQQEQIEQLRSDVTKLQGFE